MSAAVAERQASVAAMEDSASALRNGLAGVAQSLRQLDARLERIEDDIE